MHEHATQIVVPLTAASLQSVRTWGGKVHADVQPQDGYTEVNISGKNPMGVQRRADQFVGYMPEQTWRRLEVEA